MKLATQTFVFAAALAASTMPGSGAMAHADPDPHMPNMQAGYCPGGGIGSQISLAYCDGVPYPDGSYWHAIQYGAPMIGHPYGMSGARMTMHALIEYFLTFATPEAR